MWQNESRDTREAYKKLAEDEKERHIQLYPNYRYQPRKPSEKKRRMTKKKADAIIAKQDINTDDNDSEAPGGYYGDLTEVRTVTFPLSAGAQLCLLDDNATASTRETPENGRGFDFAPSQEYADAQEADLKAVGMHLGSQFRDQDPFLPDPHRLGSSAHGFTFGLNAYEFAEYSDDMIGVLQ